MATNYPGAIDNYTNPSSSEPMNAPSHAGQHANANDAVEAIETELGTNPKGSAATVKARLDGIEDGSRLGTNSVGATQIANDSVDTAAIQAGAVTAAKIADDTITAAQIAANAVGASELADSAVTPVKLARPIGNLLTANQASVENDTTGFFSYQSPTLTREAGGSHGSYSLRVEATTTASIELYLTGGAFAGGRGHTVEPGVTYTFAFDCWTNVGSRTHAARIVFRDASDNTLTDTSDGYVADAGSPIRQQVTATAPATAAYAMIMPRTGAGSIGDVIRFDRFSFHKGAGGEWAMPGVPIPGLGAIKANGAVELPGGDYAPEGVVTANPGSTFLQTSGAATVTGMLSWRKATGTGNTGWVAEGALADTGWRLIASWNAAGTVTGTMPPDIVPRTGVAGNIRLRRFGTTVVMEFNALQLNGPGPNMSAGNIAGFLDIVGADQWISMYNGSSWSAPLLCQSGGSATWVLPGTTGHFNLRTAWTWQTADAWPSSLPGSAV